MAVAVEKVVGEAVSSVILKPVVEMQHYTNYAAAMKVTGRSFAAGSPPILAKTHAMQLHSEGEMGPLSFTCYARIMRRWI